MGQRKIGWMTRVQVIAAYSFGITGMLGYLDGALQFVRAGRLLVAAAFVAGAAAIGCVAVVMLKHALSYDPEP